MYKINGTANINAIRAAAEQGRQMLFPYHFLRWPLPKSCSYGTVKDLHDVYTGN